MPEGQARPPGDGHHQPSAVYAWLLAREEQANAQPGRSLGWTAEQPSRDGSQERLAAIRHHDTVDVSASRVAALGARRPGDSAGIGALDRIDDYGVAPTRR